jgi:hypothetical protein
VHGLRAMQTHVSQITQCFSLADCQRKTFLTEKEQTREYYFFNKRPVTHYLTLTSEYPTQFRNINCALLIWKETKKRTARRKEMVQSEGKGMEE